MADGLSDAHPMTTLGFQINFAFPPDFYAYINVSMDHLFSFSYSQQFPGNRKSTSKEGSFPTDLRNRPSSKLSRNTSHAVAYRKYSPNSISTHPRTLHEIPPKEFLITKQRKYYIHPRNEIRPSPNLFFMRKSRNFQTPQTCKSFSPVPSLSHKLTALCHFRKNDVYFHLSQAPWRHSSTMTQLAQSCPIIQSTQDLHPAL